MSQPGCLDLPAPLALPFLRALGSQGGVDVFLSARKGRLSFLAGLGPRDELLLDERTGRDELARFLFSDERPAMGFLSYEYGLRRLGIRPSKPSGFPLGHLKKHATHLIYEDGRLRLLGDRGVRAGALASLLDRAAESATGLARRSGGLGRLLAASLDRQAYEDAVRRTQERIRDGDTYQLNLSIRFTAEAPDLDAFDLFLDLAQNHPAAYYGFLESGPRRIVSTSPERFLRVRGGQVLSQPIKGTGLAGRDPAASEAALRASAKEDAELSMIVDLVRNDISAHCEPGSVRVHGHKDVFRVDDLLQMRSSVTGRLRPGSTVLDLLLDAFPPGSVTGCPKKRSCEIIEALEPHARDVYCGTLLAVYGPRDMDSSVAIRTGWLDTLSGFFHFYAGSGIVVDSEPSREYEETLSKASKFLQLLTTGEP